MVDVQHQIYQPLVWSLSTVSQIGAMVALTFSSDFVGFVFVRDGKAHGSFFFRRGDGKTRASLNRGGSKRRMTQQAVPGSSTTAKETSFEQNNNNNNNSGNSNIPGNSTSSSSSSSTTTAT